MSRGLIVVGVAAGVLLTGCGGSDATNVLRSPSPVVASVTPSAATPAATDSASAPPSSPAAPTVADTLTSAPATAASVPATGSGYPATAEGASAIAKAFYLALDSYLQTGNGDAYVRVTSAKCPCRVAQQTLKELGAAHQKLIIGNSTNIRTSGFSNVGGFGLITTTYDAPGDSVLDSNGKTVRHDRGRHNVIDVLDLSPEDGTWVVSKVNRLNEGTL